MTNEIEDLYKNFCVHPFVKMFVTTTGHMKACCYAKQLDSDDINILGKDVDEVWNSKTLQKLRHKFNQRIIPKNICKSCIESEEQGIISNRQYENHKWKSLADYYYKNAHTVVPSPLSFDLRMSNECNLQCVMCNSTLSNQIAKNMLEYNKFGKSNPYTNSKDLEVLSTSSNNFNQRFVDHILANAKRTQEIMAVGGEPFVMKGFTSLIEELVNRKESGHIKVHIISNGTIIKESWIEKYLTKFKHVNLSISLEATGKVLEYVRYPSAWSALESKILRSKKICDQYENFQITLEPTIQLLNLKDLPNLLDFIKQNKFPFNTTFLDWPEPLHFANSPIDYRIEIVKKIETFLPELKTLNLIDDYNWLDWIKTEPQKTLSDKQRDYFRYMLDYFDSTRATKFLDLYPEFGFLKD